MNDIEVLNLCKTYAGFSLKNVTFNVQKGSITGFIGRNGAGKSTTLSCLLDFVHPDSGEVKFFDKSFLQNELMIKQNIGFVSGGTDFYPHKKIKQITKITKSFYPNWSDEDYQKYCKLFAIDENKTPSNLSNGMKIKYLLSLALSHNAQLLILDEPTSGLDPVSRDELLDIFMELNSKGITILFSTHITSDLDKCADDIVYIKNGSIEAVQPVKTFVSQFVLVNADDGILKQYKDISCGVRKSKSGSTVLLKKDDALRLGEAFEPCNLDEIIVHLEKEEIV